MSVSPDNLIWIDLEMTGLEPQQDHIIEIATIVTDANLEIIAEGPVLAIHQSEEILGQMDEWNTNTHTASGLVERVRASQVDESAAAQQTLEFLAQYLPERSSPMCGNSICQDRRFLARHMPQLEAFFHYRNLDVSTLKELAKRWRPGLMENFSKKGSHQALDDIRESIEELRYYREHFLCLE
jgi:oligoribonuclease